MITNRAIGTNGRFANQIYQIAFLIAQSIKHNVKIGWRPWEYAKYFKGNFTPSLIPMAKTVVEPAFHYTPDFYDELDWSADIDFHGYFQSYKYWSHCEDEIRAAFAFNDDFKELVRAKNLQALAKPSIALHVRRGDYVNNQAYAQLTPLYYLSALEKHFPDWREQNLIFFSDDKAYCDFHFGVLPNYHFAGGNEIEDLCLMALCQGHIIANSSFSWWGAWLAKSEKVVRPARHFAGTLAHHDIRDLYPPEWIAHEAEALDFTDVTFMIPVSYDHQDRVENLELVLDMLMANFDTNFKVCEHNSDRFKWAGQFADYTQFESPYFHRTKMLNQMASECETPFIVNYDADVLFPPAQLWQAVEMLRSGVDVVYPYSGRFVRMPRKPWHRKINDAKDLGVVAGQNFPVLRKADASSTGGCILFNRESFWRGGGENENMVSFSPDDVERFHRFTKLGFKVARIPGNLWHVEHFCGSNSGVNHPMMEANRKEWQKVQAMTADELRSYVESWQMVEA